MQSSGWVSMDMDVLGQSFYNIDHPLSEQIRTLKERALLRVLSSGRDDLLREYARTTGGLVTNTIRTKAWARFLGLKTDALSVQQHFLADMEVADLPPHRDEDQVRLDLVRFTVDHDTQLDSSGTGKPIEMIRKSLFHLITSVLRKYPSLSYYQGYHDIAGTILLVCGDDQGLAAALLEKMTLLHLRDFMVCDISLSVNHLRVLSALLEASDSDLFALATLANPASHSYAFLQGLSSVLTQYAHDMPHRHVLAVWDFVLSYDSVAASLYVYVAALIVRKQRILRAVVASDADQAHSVLSPSSLLADLSEKDVVSILHRARSLIETMPLSHLPRHTFSAWFRDFNPSSVLNNTSCMDGPSMRDTIALELPVVMAAQEEEILCQQEHEREEESLASSVFGISSASTLASSLSSSFSSLKELKKIFRPRRGISLLRVGIGMSVGLGAVAVVLHFGVRWRGLWFWQI